MWPADVMTWQRWGLGLLLALGVLAGLWALRPAPVERAPAMGPPPFLPEEPVPAPLVKAPPRPEAVSKPAEAPDPDPKLLGLATELGGLLVRCPAPLPSPFWVSFDLPEVWQGRFPVGAMARPRGGIVEFHAPLGISSARYSFEGEEQGLVSWEEGPAGSVVPCTFEERHALTGVHGAVRGADGQPVIGAWVSGCGGWGSVGPDGGFFMLARAGRCALAASRRAGPGASVTGPEVVLQLTAGRDLSGVELIVPDLPPDAPADVYQQSAEERWQYCYEHLGDVAELEAATRWSLKNDPNTPPHALRQVEELRERLMAQDCAEFGSRLENVREPR